MANHDLPLVLFKADLAKVLRCSMSTIEKRMRYRNDLPPMMAAIDDRPRWHRDTVLAWIAKPGAAHRFARRSA